MIPLIGQDFIESEDYEIASLNIHRWELMIILIDENDEKNEF